jgi:predicted glutamine amidotransferase
MCRLFGLLTTRDDDRAEPWLVGTERSLLAQSHASPETAQRDGWGVGWYVDPTRVRVEKGIHGAFEPSERERFLAAARASRPPLVIGHLRHASNPLGLPSDRLLGTENSQPFDTHTQLFAHNGSIPFPNETRPFLGVHEEKVKGVNDSEVLFGLLARNTEETRDPLRGFVQSVEDLVRVWIGAGRPKSPPFSGLNVLYAPSSSELWAFCLWTGDHGPGLLDRSRRYYEMAYLAAPHRVVIGSEPFDAEHGAWSSLTSGTYLRALQTDGRVELRRGSIPLPTQLEIAPVPA